MPVAVTSIFPNVHQIQPTKPHPERREKAPYEVLVVELEAFGYSLAWLGLFTARLLCIGFLFCTLQALRLLKHPFMVYYTELLQPGLERELTLPILCVGALSLAHVYQLLRMVLFSFRAGQLVLAVPARKLPTSPTFKRLPDIRRRLTWMLRWLWDQFFTRRGFFGVESSYFNARYVSREVLEIISQSIQAYTSSKLIGKMWINHLYVTFVVLNCWSTPIIGWFTHPWPPLERLLCLVVDTILDSGTAMLLPLILIAPYAQAFDRTFYSFAADNLYNDVWFVNLILENRQIFPLHTVDFFFKFIPHVSIYLSIGSMRALIRGNRHRRPKRRVAAVTVANMNNSDSGPHPDDTPTRGDSITASRTGFRIRDRIETFKHIRLEGRNAKIVHTSFFCWGLIILGCHLVTISRVQVGDAHHAVGCKQQLRPWLVSKSACSVYEFNCHRLDVDSMSVDALEFLHAESLASLAMTHCRALRVSPSIRRFPNLLGIEVYNSTLVEWSVEAAITGKTHPALTWAFIVHTNMSELPPGLLVDLPHTLLDIEISMTNLSSLPDDLDQKWGKILTLYVEYAQLDTFPDVLMRMELDDLSLIGNRITKLPDSFSAERGSFFMLSLAENPISSLPLSLLNVTDVGFINLVGTDLGAFPVWVNELAARASGIFVNDTPVCQAMDAATRERDFGDHAKISCTYWDKRVTSRYPLNLTAPLRAP